MRINPQDQTVRIAILNYEPLKDKLGRSEFSSFYTNSGKIFKEQTYSLNQLPEVLTSGRIIASIHDTPEFKKESGYSTKHLVGSQIVFVDLDGLPEEKYNPDIVFNTLTYKPTFYHTSYTNKQKTADHPDGDKEWRIHMYYVFDNVIYGFEHYKKFFDVLKKQFIEDFKRIGYDITKYFDMNVRSPRRIINTCYKDKPENKAFYREKYTGIVYNEADFDLSSVEQKKCHYNNSITKPEDKFELNKTFYDELYSLSWNDIIAKYSTVFQFYYHTYVDRSLYNDRGYADLRGMDYYEVPSWKVIYINDKIIVPKVKNGNRNNLLFLDALNFMAIIPDITKEHLVYCLIRTVYHHYDYKIENDSITTTDIINKAREAWDGVLEGKYYAKPTGKKFKIDIPYWYEKGCIDLDNMKGSIVKICAMIMNDMKDNDFGNLYDTSISLEDNLQVFHEYGMKTKKQTLVSWLKQNNIEYFTKKDERNKLIIELHNENPERSNCEIVRICKERGISVTDKTISKIRNEFGIFDSPSKLECFFSSLYIEEKYKIPSLINI